MSGNLRTADLLDAMPGSWICKLSDLQEKSTVTQRLSPAR